jgi:hypothetical protein
MRATLRRLPHLLRRWLTYRPERSYMRGRQGLAHAMARPSRGAQRR